MTHSPHSSRSHWLLGTNFSQHDTMLNQGKLPTEEQVLRAYLAMLQELTSVGGAHVRAQNNSRIATERLVGQISVIYGKARVPLKPQSTLTPWPQSTLLRNICYVLFLLIRYRVMAATSIAQIVKETWQPPHPAALHWDGKIMAQLHDKYKLDDRLPVLVSGTGIGGVKLLGAPPLPVKSSEPMGTLVCRATCDLLAAWNAEDAIGSMVFDTTASNTGQLTAACVTIQTHLGRPLLWSACRKHVGEVLLSHVWDALKIEVSQGPETLLFKKFRTFGFEATPHQDADLVTSREMPEPFSSEATAIRVMLDTIVEKNVYPRGDYKELVSLLLGYLGGPRPNLQKPGAIHKARWMAKQIYCFKMVMLQNYLPKGVITKAQIVKITRFAEFCAYVFNPWWLSCPVAASAPRHDLLLLKTLSDYMSIDPVAAKAATKAFTARHLWYLTPEMLPLTLWDTDVPVEDRQAVATAILSQPRSDLFVSRFGSGHGKPDMSLIDTADIKNKTLSDFIGQDSWQFSRCWVWGLSSSRRRLGIGEDVRIIRGVPGLWRSSRSATIQLRGG